jgi:hypothetical protein
MSARAKDLTASRAGFDQLPASPEQKLGLPGLAVFSARIDWILGQLSLNVKGRFQMTIAELIHTSHGFRKMIEAIPKTRVREHLPAINQISTLLEQLKREAYAPPRMPDVWRAMSSGKD